MQWSTLVIAGVVVVAALAGPVGTTTAQSDEQFVTLTVETFVPSSNQVVGGVTLVATWEDGSETVTTRANGQALIDVPEAATVQITTDDDQYTRNEPYTIRVATEKSHTIDVARKADLDVVVTDGEGPVEDAQVTLRQDGIRVASGNTDSQGRFGSGTVAQGRYTVSVNKPGYFDTSQTVLAAGSPEETISIERGRVDYDIAVEDTHFQPAEAVPNATVRIQGVGERTTDERGAASTLLPVNTELELTVSKAGYETTTETITVNESQGSTVVALSRSPSLSIDVLNERVVVGESVPVEVTNEYGEPAAGVAILVDGEPVRQTDDEGEARMPIEASGDLEVRARQGETTSQAVTVRGVSEESGSSETIPSEESTTTSEGPGFGPLVVVTAVVVLFLFARRRGER